MAIPKVIHYCWFGGGEIPDEYQKYIDGWKEICPEYEIIKWDERNYDVSKNRFLREAVKQKKWAFVSDYARLDIVKNYGGIYLDVDVQLVRRLDPLLEHKSFWGIEKNFDGKIFVNNGLGFGAEKNNELVNRLECLYDQYEDESKDIFFVPCPEFQLSTFVDLGFEQKNEVQDKDNNVFYSTEYFSPKEATSNSIKITPNTYSIHHFAMSWLSDQQKELFFKYSRWTKVVGAWVAERLLVAGKKLKYIFRRG